MISIVNNQKKVMLLIKHSADKLISFFLIIGLLPLLLVIAGLIKFEDYKAPIIFKQTRIGKNGVPFTMMKFRTMVRDSERQLDKLLAENEVEGYMFKIKKDPRITKVGSYLRKYSLDELPQLFNVLRGQMSLIGPRPALVNEVEKYNSYDRQRLLVKPGCSGLWQVSGRSLLSFDQMVALDLEYINNMSISQDIKIFFKTIFVVLTGYGAY